MVAVTACGQQSPRQGTTTQDAATFLATASAMPSTSSIAGLPPVVSRSVTGRDGDLQLGPAAYLCNQHGYFFVAGAYQADTNLVLVDPQRTSYGTGELTAVKSFFQLTGSSSGAVQQMTDGVLVAADGGPTCIVNLEITNVGAAPLTFARLGFRPDVAPQPNAFHYTLIDDCPFYLSGGDCPAWVEGGPPNCLQYNVDLTLVGSETAGTVVAGMLGPKGKGCPAEELTLQPQDTAAVSVTIHGTGSYIYHGMLVLQQDVGNGRLTDYPLASTATALDLAQESQFSCENISSGTTTAVKLGPVTPFSGIDCV